MQDQMFFAYKHRGKSYDCGSKLGFLTANVAFALARPDLAQKFRRRAEKASVELEGRQAESKPKGRAQ